MPGDARIDDIDRDGDKDIIAVIYDTSVIKPPPASVKAKSSSVFVYEKEGNPVVCGDGEIESGEQCETNTDCSKRQVCNNCQCAYTDVIELISFEADAGWSGWLCNGPLPQKLIMRVQYLSRGNGRRELHKNTYCSDTVAGNNNTGSCYKFIDKGLKNNKEYFYKLEDVDVSGNSTYHGPVSATPSFFASFK